MSFYVIYNSDLNNALVGIVAEPLSVVEPLRIKGHSGDMPDLTKMAYNPATLGFYPKGRLLTKLEYLRRFTGQERVMIRQAAKTEPVLEDYLALLELADNIPLDDPDTVAAVGMLEMVGLIASGRAAEILA